MLTHTKKSCHYSIIYLYPIGNDMKWSSCPSIWVLLSSWIFMGSKRWSKWLLGRSTTNLWEKREIQMAKIPWKSPWRPWPCHAGNISEVSKWGDFPAVHVTDHRSVDIWVTLMKNAMWMLRWSATVWDVKSSLVPTKKMKEHVPEKSIVVCF